MAQRYEKYLDCARVYVDKNTYNSQQLISSIANTYRKAKSLAKRLNIL
jgi:hypothetical protein